MLVRFNRIMAEADVFEGTVVPWAVAPEAIDQASPGDTVQGYDGTYTQLILQDGECAYVQGDFDSVVQQLSETPVIVLDEEADDAES